jgi:hypothetical protein
MNHKTLKISWSIRCRVAALVSIIAATVPIAEAAAANYNFVNVADSGQFRIFAGFGLSLNNHGTVAFAAAQGANDRGVFTGAGGPITTIIDRSGAFDDFRWTSINDSGTVAFAARRDISPLFSIVISDGGPVTTISDPIFTDGIPSELAQPAINSLGTVAFRVGFSEHDPLRRNFAIYTGSGGPLTLIADSSGPLGHAAFAEPLGMNDHGTVAFLASMDAGGFGMFSGNGGPLTPIVTSASGFTNLQEPSINADGTVAFFGERTGGVVGIFAHRDGTLTTIADSSGPFTGNFGNEVDINASGKVAFKATLDAGGSGIFTGPDPVADKVIQTGDALFGSTVTVVGDVSARTSDIFDMNDHGEIAFRYELANGVSGIAVARIVPEPSSAIVLSVVLGVWRSRRRRHA